MVKEEIERDIITRMCKLSNCLSVRRRKKSNMLLVQSLSGWTVEFYSYIGQYSVTISLEEFRVVELKDVEDLTTREVASRRKMVRRLMELNIEMNTQPFLWSFLRHPC